MKCCNHRCDEGRDCPLRDQGTPLPVSILQAVLLTACALLLSVILVDVFV